MKKTLISILFLISFVTINVARADLLSDSNAIFNWLEDNYAPLFSPKASTQFIDGWRYRYYKIGEHENYVGINDSADIYLLGTLSGNELKKVATVADLLVVVPH